MLTIRYSTHEFETMMNHKIKTTLSMPKDLDTVISQYASMTSFLLPNDVVEDYCHVATTILCDHKIGLNGDSCACDAEREWQANHYLLSRFKSNTFKTWIANPTWHQKNYFDWYSFGAFLRETLVDVRLLTSDSFMMYVQENDKKCTYTMYNSTSTFLEILSLCSTSSSISISAIHYNPLLAEVIPELTLTRRKRMQAMIPLLCLTSMCDPDKCQDFDKRPEISQWVYCPLCQGGPFCSVECIAQIPCRDHFCSVESQF